MSFIVIRTRVIIVTGLIALSLTVQCQTENLPNDIITFDHEGVFVKGLFYTTHDIDQSHGSVKKLIVVVHGTLRNGDDYFDNMRAALNLRPAIKDQVAIIAPQFITDEDVDFHGLDENYPYWSSSGWSSGSTSRNPDPNRIRLSSFEYLDTLITRALLSFPDVEEFVFTGHSAGAQLTNAYTASSPIFETLCTDYEITSKSIVANPGRYVYMSPRRRVGDSIEDFAAFSGDCSDYNEWSYGLEDLFIYPDRAGADQIKAWMGEREVVYLLGDQDTDPDDTLNSCRAKAQGEHRLERGRVYYNHLIDTYGTDITALHQQVIVPNVGHDNFRMYNSEQGLTALFDNAPITTCKGQTTSISEQVNHQMRLFPNPVKDILNIELLEKNTGSQSFILYDVNGGIRLSQSGNVNDNLTLDLSNQESGVYYLKVSSEDGFSIFPIIRL